MSCVHCSKGARYKHLEFALVITMEKYDLTIQPACLAQATICIHTLLQTYIHTYIHAYTYIHIHTYMYIHTYINKCIHTCMERRELCSLTVFHTLPFRLLFVTW